MYAYILCMYACMSGTYISLYLHSMHHKSANGRFFNYMYIHKYVQWNTDITNQKFQVKLFVISRNLLYQNNFP